MDRESLVRVSMVVYVVLLAISFTLLSAAGTNVPIYLFLAALSLVPLACGRRNARIFGLVALVVALGLAVTDYQKGQALAQRMRSIRQQGQKEAEESMHGTETTSSTKPLWMGER